MKEAAMLPFLLVLLPGYFQGQILVLEKLLYAYLGFG